MHIIVKNYAHHNTSFKNWDTPKGVWVKSKDHYDRLMKEQGMVSYEKAQEIADKSRKSKIKDYKVSKETMAIIEHAKNSKDKHGNVKLSDRAIDILVKKKIIGKKIPDYMKLPACYDKKG